MGLCLRRLGLREKLGLRIDFDQVARLPYEPFFGIEDTNVIARYHNLGYGQIFAKAKKKRNKENKDTLT